jgi:A/G-specific adenine glycosylase
MVAPRIRHLRAVQRALLDWHRDNGLRAPWRESRDPYHCLVAAVMAQQTQMSRVMPSYGRFVAAYPTLESLAESTLGDVIRVWAGMGYNQRAVRLHRAAQQIAANGWPHDAALLEQIDGIGPFTAAIIASFAFGESSACVDTNVRRVLGRLAGDEEMGASDLQRLADASIPRDAPARWNQAVMDYGARICKPRPRCGECAVARWCDSRARFGQPPLRKVAEERPAYRAVRGKPQAAYEGSPRYYRGRIVELLRSLPAGESMPMRRLTKMLAHGATTISEDEVRELVGTLAAQGLAVKRGARVALPD